MPSFSFRVTTRGKMLTILLMTFSNLMSTFFPGDEVSMFDLTSSAWTCYLNTGCNSQTDFIFLWKDKMITKSLSSSQTGRQAMRTMSQWGQATDISLHGMCQNGTVGRALTFNSGIPKLECWWRHVMWCVQECNIETIEELCSNVREIHILTFSFVP